MRRSPTVTASSVRSVSSAWTPYLSRTISATTARSRTRTGSLRDIASELGVTHLLKGSMRKGGERLRIAAALIDAERDASVRSKT